jgi:hypothetical protein
MTQRTMDPGDGWPWGDDFEKLKSLEQHQSQPRIPEANAAAVLANDGPGYLVTAATYIYFYEDRPSIVHHKVLALATGQYDNDRAGVQAKCIGIFCIVYATLSNGSHRLLSGRTYFYEDAGGWQVMSFRVSDMREGPQ